MINRRQDVDDTLMEAYSQVLNEGDFFGRMGDAISAFTGASTQNKYKIRAARYTKSHVASIRNAIKEFHEALNEPLSEYEDGMDGADAKERIPYDDAYGTMVKQQLTHGLSNINDTIDNIAPSSAEITLGGTKHAPTTVPKADYDAVVQERDAAKTKIKDLEAQISAALVTSQKLAAMKITSKAANIYIAQLLTDLSPSP